MDLFPYEVWYMKAHIPRDENVEKYQQNNLEDFLNLTHAFSDNVETIARRQAVSIEDATRPLTDEDHARQACYVKPHHDSWEFAWVEVMDCSTMGIVPSRDNTENLAALWPQNLIPSIMAGEPIDDDS